MSPIKTPNPDDVALGAAIRQRRVMIGISQEKLADGLGITFQQIQKYEKGTNRVSWSRLVQIAKALNCSIAGLMKLAEPAENELAGAVDIETLSVVRVMRGTSPEKRSAIRRVVFAMVEG